MGHNNIQSEGHPCQDWGNNGEVCSVRIRNGHYLEVTENAKQGWRQKVRQLRGGPTQFETCFEPAIQQRSSREFPVESIFFQAK